MAIDLATLTAKADRLETIRLKRSVRPWVVPGLVLTLLAFLAAAALYFDATPGNADWIIWIFLVLAVLGAGLLFSLALRPEYLVVDAEGLMQPSAFGEGKLAWWAIENIRAEGNENRLCVFDIVAGPGGTLEDARDALLAISNRGLVMGRYGLEPDDLAALLKHYQGRVRQSAS
ncbi:MAG: hypothetical protein ACPGNT_03020 [Rhodospirillales bacterium]